MGKNSQDFSMDEVMRIAKSPAGQQVLAALQKLDSGKLQQVADKASAGDYGSAQKMLQSLLGEEQSNEMAKKLGG